MTEDDEFEGDVDGGRGTTSEFWADEAARRVAEAGRPPVVKGGVSPSGVPHIGNFNEIARGYFVARALERLAHSGDADFTADDVRQVFTSDDRDPLRRVPSHVVDADGDVVELPEPRRSELERHVGRPYVDVPAPFGT
ncbi:MAG: lysine--tRNA ligase, partial [Halobacteriota archaeon]